MADRQEQITVGDEAVGLTSANVNAFERLEVVIVVEEASIRFWVDPTGTPTAAVGMLVHPGTVIKLHRRDLARGFQAFRAGDVDAQLSVQYCENASYDDAMPVIEIMPESALRAQGGPERGTDAAGADAYSAVVTAPAWPCTHLLASVETEAAIISLDGGTTDHIEVPADSIVALDGLSIAPGASIKAKNRDAGQNYANLSISVW